MKTSIERRQEEYEILDSKLSQVQDLATTLEKYITFIKEHEEGKLLGIMRTKDIFSHSDVLSDFDDVLSKLKEAINNEFNNIEWSLALSNVIREVRDGAYEINEKK